jgi:hypothetical protein
VATNFDRRACIAFHNFGCRLVVQEEIDRIAIFQFDQTNWKVCRFLNDYFLKSYMTYNRLSQLQIQTSKISAFSSPKTIKATC